MGRACGLTVAGSGRFWRGTAKAGEHYRSGRTVRAAVQETEKPMPRNVIYIIGLVVVVLAVLWFFGLR